VAGESLNQARHLADEAKGQLIEQSRVQRDRLVDTMRTFSGDLDRMASGESPSSGLASDLVRQAAERTRELCARLEGREPAQVLDDVRGFARRRPGTFLLGSLVAGVVAGRLLRGAKDGSGTTAGSHAQTGPAYDASHAGSALDGETTGTDTPVATAPGAAPDQGTEWKAPQPVTGPLEVDEPGQGAYRDSGTGSK
jgi:hypothetical protein